MQDLKSDPRLKGMDPHKLDLLLKIGEELSRAPKEKKMQVFMSLNKTMAEKGLKFTNEETSVLMDILTAGLSPEEKSKVDMVKRLAGSIGGFGKNRR